MAKVKIKHEGKTQIIELDGSYTKEDRKLLEKLGIIEEVKPKKKYKNVENKKDASKNDDGGDKEVQETSEEGTKED